MKFGIDPPADPDPSLPGSALSSEPARGWGGRAPAAPGEGEGGTHRAPLPKSEPPKNHFNLVLTILFGF